MSTRLIKRYANRKLYDTEASRYVTLDQIAKLIRGGEDVRIVDNGTKQDITEVTLAQIVYEEAKSGESSDGKTRSLRGLIREGRERIVSSFRAAPKESRNLLRELRDELQRLADDRLRAILASAASHVEHLQNEVGALQQRIEELEKRLGSHENSAETTPKDGRVE